MTLVRFSGVSDRGPSGKLWNGLVDWTQGTLAVAGGVVLGTDFFPYNAGDITLSGDSGSAVTLSAVPYGVINVTATQAADAVSGWQWNCYVDLTSINEVVIEVEVTNVDDDATTETFVGFTDEALDGFWGADNTPDGSAIGLRWNADETIDLIAIGSTDTITELAAAIATVERTAGSTKLGVRIKRETTTNYTVWGSVNGATTKVNTTSTIVPQVAMLPTVAHTNDNESAPNFTSDWGFVLDNTAG
jgi:hypothetical protein